MTFTTHDRYGECPACHQRALLSDAWEGGVVFRDPLCPACRAKAIRESQMDTFDHMYARAIANGWAD